MRRLILISAVVIGLGALGGCVTPSIPIPPPDPARMNFDVTTGPGSTAVFNYEPDTNYADATVYVFNRETGMGIIDTARADGSVGPTSPIAATVGDQIVVSFSLEDQTVSRCIRLQNGPQNPNLYCGP